MTIYTNLFTPPTAALFLFCSLLAGAVAAAPLQVSVEPAGGGTLTLSQSGIEQVTLTVTPSEGYLFSGFSGWNSCGADSPHFLTLTANFTAQQQDSSFPGTLAVSQGTLAASGAVGGSFSPAALTYTLRNTGGSTIQWGVAAAAPWLALSASGGILAPGSGTVVTVSLSGSAGWLGTGYYTDSLHFSNLTNTLGDTVRAASLVVADRPGEIVLVTDGDSFSPVLIVESGARVLWSWADGTTSDSATPVKYFGSSGVRVNRLTVTPWSALKRVNLGYDASDGGDPAIERVPPQPVIAVAGLEHVAPYLQKWCSAYARIASLNFDNFVNLDTVECFQALPLAQVSLHNTPKLYRACFERCQLGELDLSESPALADLRSAANPFPGISFGTTGTRLWHLCTNDNQMARSFPPMSQFPQLRELLIGNNNQSGALATASSQLTLVVAKQNHYTSANFSGGFSSGNGWLDVSDNRLSSLDLTGCPGLVSVFAGNNELGSDAVDYVLATLDSLGRYTGHLDLQGNSPPSGVGLQHAESLRQRGWFVNLAAGESNQPPPGSITFTTENDSVSMQVQATGNPVITWHWSDGTTDSGEMREHHFPGIGHRLHYLTVEPSSALTYFGTPYGVTQQGISSVSGLCGYPNLSFLYLYQESLTTLDLTGCAPLRELHLAGNPMLPSAALDKVFTDLDALGGYGGTLYYSATAATPSSAAARARLVLKGWKVSPM